MRAYLESDRGAWQGYVLGHALGTVFHRLEWSDAVHEAYGHRPAHLVACSAGRLTGVLPLMEVRSPLTGRAMVSVPYATYGGVLADDVETARALLSAAQGLCRRDGWRVLELRHRDESGLDLPVIDRYDTFRKQLPGDAEEVLAGLPKKARAAARKGRLELGENAVQMGSEHLGALYRLYCETVRRLGSPNYRRSLFEAMLRHYGEDCVVTLVRDGDRPVAGVMSFVFRDEITPYWCGSLDGAAARSANNVMYVHLMEYAVRRGLKWFDFNRTRRDNRGPYDFKRHHGFEPAPLRYQVWASNGGRVRNVSPSNPKFALAGRVWRRLPLWVTQVAGGQVSKWIP